ncbi:hypothetical protein TorRG33x02_333590 [Trema orientale]|uniref:Transmembrane protein n=1 Tax=Trema orientale TaxID=63057 RepID=A0A2P5B415_TREOI|nr:hypothetical protein TorRG33x02_333590 [Trema orientale]
MCKSCDAQGTVREFFEGDAIAGGYTDDSGSTNCHLSLQHHVVALVLSLVLMSQGVLLAKVVLFCLK